METALQILAGLALLTLGGEGVVRGAVGVARRLGVSELLIGLTLIGFGTSAPELITSLNAAFAGAPGIAVGNVVGSNISNILLIFAVVAIARPIVVDPRALKRDGMTMLAVSLLMAGVGLTFDVISRPLAAALVLGLAIYIAFAWWTERKGGAAAELHEAEAQTREPVTDPLWQSLTFAVGGIAVLILGADLLVRGAVTLATLAGLSETVIGLTIVAVGTSLPELVASLAAALKGRSDVAFGNVIGSNIYNLLGILGVTALVHPIAIPEDMVLRDWGTMAGAAALLVFHAWTGRRVRRSEGVLLLSLYVLYTTALLLGWGSTGSGGA